MKNKIKNNKKQKQRKVRQNAPRRPPRITRAVPRLDMLTHQVCGMYNPFCEQAIGAHLPTQGSNRSLTACLRFTQAIGATPNNVQFYAFNLGCAPCHYANAGVATPTASTMVSSWTSLNTDVTAFFANVSEYRIVSSGIKFSPILAATAAKPLMTVGIYEDPRTMPGDVFTYGSFAKDPQLRVFPVTDWTYISKPNDARANEFTPVLAVSPYDHVNFNYFRDALVIQLAPDAASTLLGYVEVVFNIKYIPLANSTGPYQMPAPLVPANVKLVELRDNVSAKVPSFPSLDLAPLRTRSSNQFVLSFV